MRAVRLRIVVLLAGILWLPACTVMESMKSAATEMTTSSPVSGPYDPPPPSPWEVQTQTQPTAPVAAPAPQPTKPQIAAAVPVVTAPAPRKVERLPEPSYTPIQTVQPVAAAAPKANPAPVKGAEKLVTINPGPAIQVHARELSTTNQSSASTQVTETAMIASSGGELVFKGPPRPLQSGGPGFVRWILLSVLVGLVLAGGAFAFLQIQRKAALAATVPPPKEKPIEGLEMKEPAGHGPDTVLDA